MPNITKEALLKVTHSITNTYSEGARFLGIEIENYIINLKKYGIKE
jgi:hypothetical protein